MDLMFTVFAFVSRPAPEEGWLETEAGLQASSGDCMGWSQMLAALKAWLEHGVVLREGMYR